MVRYKAYGFTHHERLTISKSAVKLSWLKNFPGFILSALILGLRPILGPATCKFELTCTRYAVAQLQELPLHKAVWSIIKRLCACSPFEKLLCN